MIWWCAEHQCGNLPNRDTKGWASVPGQSGACLFAEEFGGGEPCRMVEALLIVKEPNGEWPRRVIEVLRYDVAALAEAGAVEIMDAIALASAGGETP